MDGKVLMVAPFESNGRYKGGILTMANTLYNHYTLFAEKKVKLYKFNTYILSRQWNALGKLNLRNITNSIRIIMGLLSITKRERFDVVYYNTSIKMALVKDMFVIRVLKQFRPKMKIVTHIHFAEFEKIVPKNDLLRHFVLKTMQKSIDQNIFLSRTTCNEFIENGVSSTRCNVIYNFQNINISQSMIEGKVNLKKEFVDIVFMGSIDSRKGILDLLKALGNVSIPYKLHICGQSNDASIKLEYKKLITSLGSRVEEHGYVTGKEKENILYDADVLVLPSYGEGFPLVIIEAMACGCSIITTPVGAIPEFLKEGENGYILGYGDISGLTSAINKIWLDGTLKKYQMLANYKISRAFSVERFIDNLCEVFNK